jgi:DNA-binding beta-propeller fold protein YncE
MEDDMPLTRFIATAFVAVLSTAPATPNERDRHSPLAFEGRYIVVVSDADMVASAYVDGDLGPREGTDTLSIVRLDGDPRAWRSVGIEASNSVASPPAVLDVTSDGRWAFVIETFTPRPDGEDPHTFADLRHGNRVQVFDLTDPDAPVLAQEIETFERPDAIRVSPDGKVVAVAFHPDGAGRETPLALYPFSEGRLGEPVTPKIPGWNHERAALKDIDWHPSQPIIALLNETEADLRFARVGEDLALDAFGNVVDVERSPLRVEFTPDGRHVVVNACHWGPDIGGTYVEAPRGSLLTIRMDAEVDGDHNIRHALISRVLTGVSPEGLAVSPDGRWVATPNLERSYLPYDDPRITWFSSITLSRLDPETGLLTRIGDFNYDGILPEAAVFDNSGNYLAVANFDHFDDRRQGSSIDFWRIQADPLDPDNVQLVKTEHSVHVPRGAHSVVMAR